MELFSDRGRMWHRIYVPEQGIPYNKLVVKLRDGVNGTPFDVSALGLFIVLVDLIHWEEGQECT
jgi:hypothetical protein